MARTNQAAADSRPTQALTWEKVPELDFMKRLLERDGLTYDDIWQLKNAYFYLLWSRRYGFAHRSTPESEVAYGMVVKYHRQLYAMPLLPAEELLVAKAETAIKASKQLKRRRGK